MKYYKPQNLLNSGGDAKTIKGQKKGWKTYIMYMSPFTDNSLGVNVCSHASAGCSASCLVGSGRGGFFTGVQKGRKNKTEYYLHNRPEFLAQLDKELIKISKKHKGEKIAIRLNGTSDIRWEKFKVRNDKNLFELFPNLTFYDYTKNHLRFDQKLPKNYSLTFSRSETNHKKAIELLGRGINVAMVFTKTPKKYEGYKIIDGDFNDLRHLNKGGVIIGLRFKKITVKGADNTLAVKSGFVIETNNVISLPKNKKITQKFKQAA